ncbi:hypothetical protein HOD29_04630 [archaeon]|jgi:predicted metal-dependent HD superfamily phosphohydrolase|nr:hypothetical protein [archaeon]
MNLEKRFDNLVQRNHYWLSSNETLFPEILKKYSEEHRHYHTIGHVRDCLEKFDLVKDLLVKPDEVEMAIFYHDIIYDVQSKDNEKKSAKYMADKLRRIGMDKDFVGGANSLILDTEKHVLGEHPDSGYMIDIDFSSLGVSLEKFNLDRENIRKEYLSIYEWEDVKFGTIDFYNQMLARDKIFLTGYFYNLCEGKARENIRKNIEILTA